MIVRGPKSARFAMAVGLLLLGGLSPAIAAKLPDWARAIAEQAPSIPEGGAEHEARVLFDEVRVTIDESGIETTRSRTAIQIIGARVSSINRQPITFQEGAKVRTYRGWHLPEGEKAQKAYQDPLELAVGENFLDDLKQRTVSVYGVGRGSLVFYEFEVEETALELSLTHRFGNEDETRLERFEVDTPGPGWTVKWDWLRSAGPAAKIDGNTWKWEVENAAAPVVEPMGPTVEERMPLLVVSVAPPPGAGSKMKAQAFPDWVAYDAWYESLIKGREAVTPEIEAAAKKAVAGAGGNGFFETVPAMARFVRDGVRYVAKEIGIEGFQPRAAGKVLDQQYGDCKDKATLLRSLLKAAGIASYPVIVNASYDDTVSDSIPSLRAFNHVVLAVPVPPGTEVPPRYVPAIADGGDLGRLLVIDTTDEYASIGAIPYYLAGKRAFVPAGEKSRIIRIPEASAANNRFMRTSSAEVHPDGSMDIVSTWRHSGAAAEFTRSHHRDSYQARRKMVERALLDAFPDAEAKAYKADPESADGDYVEAMTWHVPPPAFGPRKEVPLFLGATSILPRTSLAAKRKTGVRFSAPLTLEYQTTLNGVPVSAALPPPDQKTGDGWSIDRSTVRDGDALVARWKLVLSKTRYDVDALPEVKKLWLAMSSSGSTVLFLNDPAKP